MIRFDVLSKQQLAVFEQIAINNDGGHNSRTLESLIKRNLIESYEQKDTVFFGDLTVIRYRVPLNVHIEWCEWCDK